jgi:N-acetyl-alpha-D-muramate 1-phosphate uridylyltransferase
MKAMVLAAGRGERMGALTANRPKPLLEIDGVSLIERHVQKLAACGVEEIVINLSYLGAQIRDRLADGKRFGLAIRYSDEGEPPLETAGGIVRALPLLGATPFLLVNADVFTDFDFATLLADPRSALVLVPNPAHNARGDFGSDESGLVRAAPPLSTYGGIAVLDPKLFAGLAQGRRPLKPVLDLGVARRELRAVHYQGVWIDVGTPERLDEARRLAVARS